MTRIVAGGTGLIGHYLVNRWLDQGHEVAVVGRSKKHISERFADLARPISWGELRQNGASLLQQSELIVNLAGTSVGEKRWSHEQKNLLVRSRTETTRTISQICAALGDKSPLLFNASAIGIYSLQANQQQLPQALTEATEIDYDAQHDFLSSLACAWEKSTESAKAHGVRVVNLRFGIVLDKTAPVLKQITFPFKLGLGGPIGQGTQPFSWIHLADVANAIEFLFDRSDINGPVNIVSPNCVMQKQWAKALGKALKKPSFMPTPAVLIKLMLGTEMANELVLYGQHVYPERLLEQGFQFQYPELSGALEEIYHA